MPVCTLHRQDQRRCRWVRTAPGRTRWRCRCAGGRRSRGQRSRTLTPSSTCQCRRHAHSPPRRGTARSTPACPGASCQTKQTRGPACGPLRALHCRSRSLGRNVLPVAEWHMEAQRRRDRTSLRRSSSFFSSMLGTKSAPCTTLRTCGLHACANSRLMHEGHAIEIASARAAGSSAFSRSLQSNRWGIRVSAAALRWVVCCGGVRCFTGLHAGTHNHRWGCAVFTVCTTAS